MSRTFAADDPSIGDRAREIRTAEDAARFRCMCEWRIDDPHVGAVRVSNALCPVHPATAGEENAL